MCIYVDVCIYVHVYVYIYICICMYVHVCVYVRVYVRVCIYTYIYVCHILYFKTFFYDLCVFIDIFNSSYFALLCKSLLTITIAILINEMNCVFTDHDYFSCYKHDVSLCFRESRIIAVSANVFLLIVPDYK